MSIAFATNLSQLRRERNVTQKIAAEELGISQALLSHYEKGIRECNLEFVARAAEYYDVTADYLLGITSSKQSSDELFDSDEIPSDNQAITKTLLRAILGISELAENDNDAIFFNDFFSLAIAKYLALSKGDTSLAGLCDIISNENINQQKTEAKDYPLCIKTVENHAKMLLAQSMEKILDKTKEDA